MGIKFVVLLLFKRNVVAPQAAVPDSPVLCTGDDTTAGQRTVVNCALLVKGLGLPHKWPGRQFNATMYTSSECLNDCLDAACVLSIVE